MALPIAATVFIAGERPQCLMHSALNSTGSTAVRPAMALFSASFFSAVGIEMSYTGSISTEGVAAMDAGTVDVGFTDEIPKPLPPDALVVPVVANALSIAYHIPLLGRTGATLNLTVPLVARLFTGNISDWLHPAILTLNPALAAAAAASPGASSPILRVVRPAGSGVSRTLLEEGFGFSRVASWADVEVQGAAPAVVVSSNALVPIEVAWRPGAVGYFAGLDTSGVAPVAAIDGFAPSASLVSSGLAARVRQVGSAALTSPFPVPPGSGYPLPMVSYAYLRPGRKAAGCCARLYWTVRYLEQMLTAAHTSQEFVPLDGSIASLAVAALREWEACGGLDHDAMRARYDLTLPESLAAQAGRDTRAAVGGALGGVAIGVVLVAALVLWVMFRARTARVRQLEEEARLAPRGQVAVLFTDIEASSRLWRAKPKEMRVALGVHFMALRKSVAANGGYEVKTEGDAMFAVFPSVFAAVSAATSAQELLLNASWPQPILEQRAAREERGDTGALLFRGLRVRMGVGWGDVDVELDPTTHRLDYFGDTVNHSSRIADLGAGGQVVISAAAADEMATHFARHAADQNRFVMRELPSATLPGFRGMHRVWEVASAALAERMGRWSAEREHGALPRGPVASSVGSRSDFGQGDSQTPAKGPTGLESRSLSVASVGQLSV